MFANRSCLGNHVRVETFGYFNRLLSCRESENGRISVAYICLLNVYRLYFLVRIGCYRFFKNAYGGHSLRAFCLAVDAVEAPESLVLTFVVFRIRAFVPPVFYCDVAISEFSVLIAHFDIQFGRTVTADAKQPQLVCLHRCGKLQLSARGVVCAFRIVGSDKSESIVLSVVNVVEITAFKCFHRHFGR